MAHVLFSQNFLQKIGSYQAGESITNMQIQPDLTASFNHKSLLDYPGSFKPTADAYRCIMRLKNPVAMMHYLLSNNIPSDFTLGDELCRRGHMEALRVYRASMSHVNIFSFTSSRTRIFLLSYVKEYTEIGCRQQSPTYY